MGLVALCLLVSAGLLAVRLRVVHRQLALSHASKDRFLANVSHEFRTPLNAILGWAHLLRSDAIGDRDHAAAVIERNANALARVVDDLVDASRFVRGQVAIQLLPVDLRRVTAAAIASVAQSAEAKGIDISLTGGEAAIIQADAERLEHAVWHLLVNSIRFTPRGGKISLELSCLGSRVQMRVGDSGVGIRSDFLAHAFDAFSQGPSSSARSGLGLGLTIVRQIVQLHDGSISIESPGLDQGTTVTVSLPVAARRDVADQSSAATPGGVPMPHAFILFSKVL